MDLKTLLENIFFCYLLCLYFPNLILLYSNLILLYNFPKELNIRLCTYCHCHFIRFRILITCFGIFILSFNVFTILSKFFLSAWSACYQIAAKVVHMQHLAIQKNWIICMFQVVVSLTVWWLQKNSFLK